MRERDTSVIGLPYKTSIGLALASLSGLTHGQTAEQAPQELDSLTVTADAEGEYQTQTLSSDKYTQPLRDVPQSITVVPQAVIEQQNAQTLEQVLSNVPGITFSSGEGAGGVGDSINIRGFNSGNYGGSNVYLDGVRDSAFYTRSEMFNTEQVEVVKGSSSSAWGAGVIGGAINMVTKTPSLHEFNRVTAGVGTADYKRLTLDTNHVLDEESGTAFRLNLVGHESGINGRDWIERDRWGIAPSLAFGLNTDTRNIFTYEHLEDTGNYDYGIPTLHDGKNPRQSGGHPSRVPGVKWDGYFGYRNLDKEDNRIDRATWRFEHDINSNVSFSNQLSFNQLQRSYVVTTPGGDFSREAGGNASLRRLRGPARHTDNQTLSDQANVTWRFDTAGIEHTLVTGLEYTREDLRYKTGSLRYGAQGNTFAVDPANPPSKFVGSREVAYTGEINAESETKAYYLIDTLKFSPQWQLDVSARQDHWKARTTRDRTRTLNTTTGTLSNWTDAANVSQKEKLFSYRGALSYKPVDNGMFYVSYGNAKQPGSIQIATTGSLGEEGLSPTKGKTYEVGTKWDLMHERLSLTAALFRTDLESTQYDSDDELGNAFSSKYRVDGLELGASGNITDKWSVFGGYAYMKSKIRSYSSVNSSTDFANPNASEEGISLPNTPRHSASLWTSYALPHDVTVSYGVNYVGERYIALGRAQAITSEQRVKVPDYVVHNAAVDWQATSDLALRLNIVNLFDKHYWRQYNGRGFGVPGEGRGAQLTAEYSF
ncbi:TonB-dependent siderophore receptor [Pseudomonas luteola]|uniref:TonB-dependent receptor n=1 Tax=Pseudomonas luteola TaxID=47886 RepID=UPI001EF61236|nr:TonB-dependent siderophore receptor [Pseudomonas luteola]MCG7372095.1 TonB-dependent siderophore receptor [Pseudomonas luteola]